MPRETIHDQAGQYHITVGWQRDKDVQIGIETADGRPLAEHLTVLSAGSDETTTSTAASFRSLWGSLDRAGVNDLIFKLRKARDGAFGKDA